MLHSIAWTKLLFLVFLLVVPIALAGEPKGVISTSVCEVAANPARFDGQLVSIRASVVSGFEVFAVRSPETDCGGMWLAYSEGGPVASTSIAVSRPQRAPITVVKDRNYKRFQRLLKAEMYPRTRENTCMGCNRYEVSATMVGRIDYAGDNQPGYGHMNGYKLQFELLSISEIDAKDLSERYDHQLFSPRPVHLPTGFLEGRLIAPNDKAYEDIWVTATRAGADNEFLRTGDADTDKHGRFKISVPPGQYVVGVNVIQPASESFPFRKTYAPTAHSYSSAQVYTVADGEHVRADIQLSAPLSAQSIPVKVEWPDGHPVVEANVWLTEAAGDPKIVVNTAVSHTRADGTFMLKGVTETDYVVHGDIYVKPGYKKFCAADVTVRASDHPELLTLVLDREGDGCAH